MTNIFIRCIPNTLTSCNLFSGCIASTMAFQGKYEWAFIFIIIGAVFDFFDGMSARLLKAPSTIGKELDSLADMTTFGLAPSFIIFSVMKEMYYPIFLSGLSKYIPFIAFLIAVFSALRLAKFNIDPRQTSNFIGLPTPANALFWGSLIVGEHDYIVSDKFSIFIMIWFILLLSWLLIAEIPMFSLKFKNLKWTNNKIRFIFLIICIPLVLTLGISSFAAIITIYVLLAVFTQKKI